MGIISVSNLSKAYKIYKKEPGLTGSIKSLFNRKYETTKAVENISFSIDTGELVGFIGPNGAGKTTTLKCLSGLLYPTEGNVNVLGFTPFKRDHTFLKQISLVMGQKNQLWWDLPAMDSLLLNKEIYEIPFEDFNKNVTDLSKLLDVKDFLKVPVRKLSLGQRMKMELIAALIHSPKVLFLDEPTIGLDVVMQKTLREFISQYNKKYNATIILTSHYMADVEALCKRIIIINHGKILFDGLLTDLVKKHAPYKLIKIILANSVSSDKIENFGKSVTFNYPELTINIKKSELQNIISKVIKTLPVEDITITDPNIEDIIRDIFNTSNVKHT